MPLEAPLEAQRTNPTNADIMNRLDNMMSQMAMKDDMKILKSEITKETKIMISEAIDPVKSEIVDVKHTIESVQMRLHAVEHRKDETMTNQIKDIENAISELSLAPSQEKMTNP